MLITACAVNPQSQNEQVAKPTQLPVTQSNQPVKKPISSTTPASTATLTETTTPEEIGFYQTPTWAEDQNWPNPPDMENPVTATPYPTFLADKVLTATLAKPNICPDENPDFNFPKIDISENDFFFDREIFNQALNQGATFGQIVQAFTEAGLADYVMAIDLTMDGQSELIYQDQKGIRIISCDNGKYTTIFNHQKGFNYFSKIYTIEDLNLNGIPDIVVFYATSWTNDYGLDMFEWDGTDITKTLEMNHGRFYTKNSHYIQGLFFNDCVAWLDNVPLIFGSAQIEFKDIDHNGTKDLIIIDDGPENLPQISMDGPWRTMKLVIKWNGEKFLYSSVGFSSPQYQFQAVQDADRLFLLREYDESNATYQQVINDTNLEWWTYEKKVYPQSFENSSVDNEPTPVQPIKNPDENAILSAYANYRIFIMQIIQGQTNESKKTFQLLQEQNPKDSAGFIFAELARIYWESVKQSGNYVTSCEPIIEYMAKYPDVLSFLGDYYHGTQSHEYEPKDVCPVDEMDVKFLQE